MKKLNGENIKRLIKKCGMTITSFSKDIDISRNSINNWINRGGNIADWKCEIIEEYFIEKYGECPDDIFMEG